MSSLLDDPPPRNSFSYASVWAASLSTIMPVLKPLRSTEKPIQMRAPKILALALGSNYHYHVIDRETEALTDFFFLSSGPRSPTAGYGKVLWTGAGVGVFATIITWQPRGHYTLYPVGTQ